MIGSHKVGGGQRHRHPRRLTHCGAILILGALLTIGWLRAAPPSETQTWNPKAAAAYLDRRAGWWMAWPAAARGDGTFCVSCHTAVPYILARPALRVVLGEQGPSENERRLLEDARKRVRLWKEETPFYTESSGAGKTLQSRGTESVLNSLLLMSTDAADGKMSDDARAAFDHMWALQEKRGDAKGAWPWLDFGNEPFEANDSQFYGASLAAVAVSKAPESYRVAPEIQGDLQLLADYVRREYARQPLVHQAVSLWASTKWPGLLAPAQQKAIIEAVLNDQQSDGGWTWRKSNLLSFAKLWSRSEDVSLARKSDGYATGLIVFVLTQAGVPPEDVHLQRGRSWLVSNQQRAEGLWPGYSLLKPLDPPSGTGRFMNDAATAYAVLALAANGR